LNDLLFDGTVALDVSVDRVWFGTDSRGRVWKEYTDGRWNHPRRHYAIDLAISNAAVRLKSMTCTRIAPSDPEVITVPVGPHAGQTLRTVWNEIPLLGRLTIHAEAIPLQVGRTEQSVGLDFNRDVGPVPVLAARSGSDKLEPQIFGPGVKRDAQFVSISGSDTRVTWDLDYHEIYLITNSPAALRGIEALKRFPKFGTDARLRLLDLIAAKMAENVRPFVAELGRHGVLQVLPQGIEIEPEATNPRSVVALDSVVQRLVPSDGTHESLVVQLRNAGDEHGTTLTWSVLRDDPNALAALAVTAFSVSRMAREACSKAFGLANEDFLPGRPCELRGAKIVGFGGAELHIESLRATVADTAAGGRIVVEASVAAHQELYDIDADVAVTYDFAVGEVPGDAKPDGSPGGTFAAVRHNLQLAAQEQRQSPLSTTYEGEIRRARNIMDALPKTTGIDLRVTDRPTVRQRFTPTPAGRATQANSAANTPSTTWDPRPVDAEQRTPGEALGLEFAYYLVALIETEWICSGLWGASTSDADAAHASALLPSIGTPIGVSLNTQRLAVYFR
jgi:hypothetical protein